MSVQPRPELNKVVPCYHGGVRHEEIRGLRPARWPERSVVMDFSVNTNPFGPSPLVKLALAEVDIQRYPESDAAALREELGRRLGIDAGNVVVGNGSVELIWLVCLAYLGRGDAALILGPTFGEYETACRIVGAKVRFCLARETDDFRPRLDEIAAAIGAQNPKLIFLCNPNNPTGHYLSKEDVERIADVAHESLVVIDEAYANLADSRWESEHLIHRGNILLLRSMTKDFALAGLRIGYAIGDAEIIDALARVRPPWSVNSYAQAAAMASLRDADHLETSRLEIRAAKRYLCAGLAEMGIKVIPSQANFLLARVGDGPSFRKKLLEKGFCVRDCSSFGLKEYVRIGVRTRKDCRDLVEAIGEVLQVDQNHTRPPRRNDMECGEAFSRAK